MAIRFRTVTGILYHAKTGEPLISATLKFELSKGFGLTDTHLITDAPVTTTTGADGSFSINLWCDEDALIPIDYAVTLPKESSGLPVDKPEYKGVFSLVYAATPIALSILLTSSVPSPLANALLYAIIDARIIAVGGGGGGTVDQAIIPGSANAVAGGAVNAGLTGKADLVGGKVPAAQLPSYVDDILEFAAVAALPSPGETGKVYVITSGADIDKQYRWSGTSYRILSFEAGGGGSSVRKLGSLRFDATKQHHVNLGQLYKNNITYASSFFHEALLAAEFSANGQYWFSDGYGAAHAGGLHGLAHAAAGQYRLTGNIWNGVIANPDHSAGDYLFYGKAQIYHTTYALDATHLYIFIDGVLAGIKPWAAARTSNGNPTGASYIGGSEHNNFAGWIFWVRFFETTLPVATLDGCFRPELLPRTDVGSGDCAFLMSFDESRQIYTDESDGFDNTNTVGARRKRHSGLLSREGQTPNPVQFSGLGNIFAGDNLSYGNTSLKDFTDAGLPQHDDTTAFAPRPYLGAAPVVPTGLLAFDSFSRADQTMLFHALPNLGTTEGGSLGALAWGSGDGYLHTWGILSGAAFTYYPNQNCEVISNAGLGVNRDVSIDRLTNSGLPRSGHEGATGLCYGYVNQGTRGVVKCFYSTINLAAVIKISETVGGEFNPVFELEVAAPANFTTITVRVEGTRRRLYTDASPTALIDTNLGSASIGTATKMGLFGSGRRDCMRFKNFKVQAIAVVVGPPPTTFIADEFVFRPRAGLPADSLGIMVQGCATNSATLGDWATLITIGGTVNDGAGNSRPITGGVAYPFLRCLTPNGVGKSLAEFEFRQAGVKIAPIASYGTGSFGFPDPSYNFAKALDGDVNTFFASDPGATNAHAGIQVY